MRTCVALAIVYTRGMNKLMAGQTVKITRGNRRGQLMRVTAVLDSTREVILDGIWLYSQRSIKSVVS